MAIMFRTFAFPFKVNIIIEHGSVRLFYYSIMFFTGSEDEVMSTEKQILPTDSALQR